MPAVAVGELEWRCIDIDVEWRPFYIFVALILIRDDFGIEV